jgi:hypothetical protein
VDRDAKSHEIERAYRRIIAEMQKETTPPDPRRRVLVDHAHDVLMDPVRREAYDAQLRSPQAQLAQARRSRRTMSALIALLVVAGAAIWLAIGSDDSPARTAKPKQEVQNAVAVSVGRVHRVELSGATVPLGLAFAIDEGTMVSSCEGLSPNAEVFVKFGARDAHVRVSAVDDATGLCRLTGATVGSWPLPLARIGPRPADRAYLVRIARTGEAQLYETRVKAVEQAAGYNAFEVEAPAAAQLPGGPLLDIEARVLGAASRVGGRPLYVHIPQGWLVERFIPEAPAAAAEPKPKEASPAPAARNPADISPERRERLEKAFHPPPQIPDDL